MVFELQRQDVFSSSSWHYNSVNCMLKEQLLILKQHHPCGGSFKR